MPKLHILFLILAPLQISSLHKSSAALEAKISTHQDFNYQLATWEASKSLRKKFPYYISGFDSEKRPVFVIEFGKYPVREIVEAGGEEPKELSKYIEQMFYRAELGPKMFFNETEREADDSVVIMDWAGFELKQFIHGPTIQFILQRFKNFQKIQHSLAYGFFVNVNSVASQFLMLARPILGSLMERVEIYGTQKHLWIPKLLRKIPKDQLPSWYGGNEKDFKPVFVYR